MAADRRTTLHRLVRLLSATAVLAAGAVALGGQDASADATVTVTMNVSGGYGQDSSGRWLVAVEEAGVCAGPVFSFPQIAVSNADVTPAAIEVTLHGFAHTSALTNLVGFSGQTVVSAWYGWAPPYGQHVVRAELGTIPSGTNLQNRSLQICANHLAPHDFVGMVSVRFVGVSADTSNPISIDLGTVETVHRTVHSPAIVITRTGMVPMANDGVPGYLLRYHVRFNPCLRGLFNSVKFCVPFIGQVQQSFTGPATGLLWRWELVAPDPVPADWDPNPPTGNLATPISPDGTQPGDFSAITSLTQGQTVPPGDSVPDGDPVPLALTVPINAWPQATCASTSHPGLPHVGGVSQAPYGTAWTCPVGGGLHSNNWPAGYQWEMEIWVPEVNGTYTLNYDHLADSDWDGTFTPHSWAPGALSAPTATYTVIPNPTITSSPNTNFKVGCANAGRNTGWGPTTPRCAPAEAAAGPEGSGTLRYTWNGGILINPTLIDEIPPGWIYVSSGMPPGLTSEPPWQRSYHAGPCDVNTPRTDPGWVL